MKIIFKIEITKEYHLKLSTINQQEEEILLVEANPFITFNLNTINFFDQEDVKSINFMKKWIKKTR